MVEQEARDFVRCRSEPHGMALERGSVVSVMVRFVGSRLLRSFFFGGGYADDIFRLILVIEDEMLIFIINL